MRYTDEVTNLNAQIPEGPGVMRIQVTPDPDGWQYRLIVSVDLDSGEEAVDLANQISGLIDDYLSFIPERDL